MTAICLVRHGETDWNAAKRIQGRTDIPLNDTGKWQAEQTGLYLKDAHWDVVISSPLSRAKETAHLILQHVHAPLVIMDDFIERDYGDAEGMSFEERQKLFPNKQYPNMEPLSALQDRMLEGIEKVRATYPDQRVLIVAHGAAIHALLTSLADEQMGIKDTRLENACLNYVEWTDGQWKVNDYNVVNHLTQSAPS
ncbi:histidine phosphatase family protein [Bacillus altitudinis]|uniref:histidine phosphatase family protein n=1 Tax=Bacillus altitudinis TaxID=293387 RepID=UPI0002F8D53E|nr:histidine phosphatase family protein [Bacillus altitudinis]MCA1013179.1 histidine phosphatase family protein [Bacillus stratosphericus]MCA2384218.1 histidine phosphatase family protein [Bacillus stratosphericus]MCA2398019.1 histidine phosphatase family protein [Bacillus stratosphericus]QKL21045.1 histidine phosphatase family protein [Bacillus altitudinis]QKL24774.1 histidine phosphatase family protein [Bacillus altitudinis]